MLRSKLGFLEKLKHMSKLFKNPEDLLAQTEQMKEDLHTQSKQMKQEFKQLLIFN